MKLDSCSFFQPVPVPTAEVRGRYPLSTAVRSDTHEITLEDDKQIKIVSKGPNKKPTFVTIYNTCWYIPAEVMDESSPSPSDTSGTSEKKVKRRTVAPKQLPTAD